MNFSPFGFVSAEGIRGASVTNFLACALFPLVSPCSSSCFHLVLPLVLHLVFPSVLSVFFCFFFYLVLLLFILLFLIVETWHTNQTLTWFWCLSCKRAGMAWDCSFLCLCAYFMPGNSFFFERLICYLSSTKQEREREKRERERERGGGATWTVSSFHM